MIKHIFFDFNGTLLDDVNLSFCLEKEIVAQLNLRQITLEEYLDNFKFPIKSFYDYLGVPDDKFSEMANYFFKQYNLREKNETSLSKNVVSILKELKDKQYKLYVLSASEINLLTKQLKYFQIFDYFDGVIGLNNIHAKSKIEVAEDYIKKYQINPSECLLIGDTLHDYQVGKTLGFRVLLYTKGHNSRKLLSSIENVALIDDFNEINKFLF